MRITQNMLHPSREDAVRLTRQEKMGMIILAYVATVLDEMRSEMKDRFAMIEGGAERLDRVSKEVDSLLAEVRLTAPINQRMNLQNTAQDFEIRLTPKLTPSKTSIVMQKEEFKELVDHAREKCRDCMEDDMNCEKCSLFQLMTVLLPLDEYHDGMLCPYNLGEWAN